MNLSLFVWTFEGVCQAVGLGILALLFAFLGFVYLIIKIEDRWENRK